jgi:apocytochrome f
MKTTSLQAFLNNSTQVFKKVTLLLCASLSFFFISDLAFVQPASAYPFWAQQTAPETPREATGRLVCANCHLGKKTTEVEVPAAVLPDTVFEAVVKIPYNTSAKQVLGDGSKGGLNVGAVLMLPDGFKIAPEDRIPEELKEKTKDLYFQTYKEGQDNVVIIGPLPGEQNQEIVFPVLSPNPATDKGIYYGKYSVHVGGNRGRGQVYPTGLKTNNTVYNASVAGKITAIADNGTDGYAITIQSANGEVVDTIPAGPQLIVAQGDEVTAGQLLTSDPNVGGFGQKDAEIVLQNPQRIQWLIVYLIAIMFGQLFLVLKKKQVEKVQAAEMNF